MKSAFAPYSGQKLNLHNFYYDPVSKIIYISEEFLYSISNKNEKIDTDNLEVILSDILDNSHINFIFESNETANEFAKINCRKKEELDFFEKNKVIKEKQNKEI